MDDSGPTAGIIFMVAFLLMQMFLSCFQAAFDALNEPETGRRAKEDGDKRAVGLTKLMEHSADYKNTMQLLTALLAGGIGAVHLEQLLSWKADWLQTVLSTLLLCYIVFVSGFLIPGRLGARKSAKCAAAGVPLMLFFVRVLLPFTKLAVCLAGGVLRLFGVSTREKEGDVTEEEIISMVNEGHEQGVIEASEAEMISNIFELGDKKAWDIMTHRPEIVAIDAATSLSRAVDFMLEEKYSRYPVYEENIDHVIGILHLKDAMRFHTEGNQEETALGELPGLLMKPCFVPQTKNIGELFREMQAEKLQMVVVVDEYGQTDGLIAMEDILEEIVGNILDEYDEDNSFIEEKGQGEYVVDGRMPLEELEECLGISFEDEECDTLNGFLISRLDRIPEPGEQPEISYSGFRFRILSADSKMIQSVGVTRSPEEAQEPALEQQGEA